MKRSFSAFVIIVVFSLALAGCRRGAEEPDFKLPRPAEPAGGAAAGPVNHNSYADVVARVSPAVVTIRAVRLARAPRQHPFLDEESSRDFFGRGGPQRQQQMQPREAPQRALGSGVVISPDGYIVTNHHVVDGAEQITVEFADRRSFPAKLVGNDPPSDLAVLKIEAKELPVLTLGDSDRVRVGDVVLAVGNPLGVGQTVTAGIISAKGRRTGLSDGSFEDFLQTDAPINQGNSGGALVNTSGELVGINSQIFSPTGGNIGIGFAIPSNMTRSVTEQLISNGRVRRGQLGVFVQQMTEDIAQSLGLKEARGVLVGSVQKGGAAERAGVKQGDVITALNGTAVGDANELRNLVAAYAAGHRSHARHPARRTRAAGQGHARRAGGVRQVGARRRRRRRRRRGAGRRRPARRDGDAAHAGACRAPAPARRQAGARRDERRRVGAGRRGRLAAGRPHRAGEPPARQVGRRPARGHPGRGRAPAAPSHHARRGHALRHRPAEEIREVDSSQ